jgi:plasmid stabilization system protein ParE
MSFEIIMASRDVCMSLDGIAMSHYAGLLLESCDSLMAPPPLGRMVHNVEAQIRSFGDRSSYPAFDVNLRLT